MIIKGLFIFLLVIHSLIHLIGISKSFHSIRSYGKLLQTDGLLWLFAFITFIIALMLFFLKIDAGYALTITGIVLSQTLILINWKEARYGTIINILLCLILFYLRF
jgi:hypothetical protein